MESLRAFIRLSRPLFLIGAALVYFLGVGIARYLGNSIDWGAYALGQMWATILQLGATYLDASYNTAIGGENPRRPGFAGNGKPAPEVKIPPQTLLIAAVACLAIIASLTVLILQQAQPSGAALVFMGLIALGALIYSFPPLRLVTSGYGELTVAIIYANLLPALAFLLQAGSLHRLLAMTTFPLTALFLATTLALQLPDYARNVKYERRTLIVRIGWRNGMNLHNWLILCAFLLLGMAAAYGLPLPIALPAFLLLPLGLLQIWQMRRVAEGARPNWKALTLLPVAIFGSMTYLLAYAFWTR